MVDGVTSGRLIRPFLREHPDAAVVDPVDTIFQPADRPANESRTTSAPHPGRRAQMDVVKPESVGVLHDLEADAPGIDEHQPEQPGHPCRRRDLRPVRFERLHRGVEIGH